MPDVSRFAGWASDSVTGLSQLLASYGLRFTRPTAEICIFFREKTNQPNIPIVQAAKSGTGHGGVAKDRNFTVFVWVGGMLDPPLREAAWTLGVSPLATFFLVVLPNIRHSALSAVVLTFAHTVGEFGVVLMVGGNIPGSTQVVSIAIYDHVEALEYGAAHFWAALLLAFSFVVLLAVYSLDRRYGKRSWL